MTAITATLRDTRTGTVINGRDEQNVLNDNGGALAADGTFTLSLGTADNVVVTPGRVGELEEHTLSLQVTYNRVGGGEGVLTHEVRMFVVNLTGV
jgi:predicted outer membrane repeat protein